MNFLQGRWTGRCVRCHENLYQGVSARQEQAAEDRKGVAGVQQLFGADPGDLGRRTSACRAPWQGRGGRGERESACFMEQAKSPALLSPLGDALFPAIVYAGVVCEARIRAVAGQAGRCASATARHYRFGKRGAIDLTPLYCRYTVGQICDREIVQCHACNEMDWFEPK